MNGIFYCFEHSLSNKALHSGFFFLKKTTKNWNLKLISFYTGNHKSIALFLNTKTEKISDISISGFFVAIGHQPNTGIFKEFITMDEAGYIKTIPGTSKTNIEGVFACGDAQDHVYRQAVTAAGTGCMAALDAERFLAALEN